MFIHVVQQGETAYDIAARYGVSAERLVLDNDIQDPDSLAEGRALVILVPRETHVVREGDTLSSIARAYGITVRQLFRNNPYLSGSDYIYPGEEIVISFENEKTGNILTYGYAYPYISEDVLIKTLPYLTYITLYSYFFTDEGELNDIDDMEVLSKAKDYQVLPIMMISPQDIGRDSESIFLQRVLINEEIQNQLIYNIINVLRAKGYYGINFNVSYIRPQNRNDYVRFMTRLSNMVKEAGFNIVFNTLSLNTFEIMTGIIYEGIDYSRLVQYIDGLFLMTYEWGNYIGIPTGIISFDKIKDYVRDMAQNFPPEKMFLGIPILGYMWELPFILGVSRGLAISSSSAVDLAKSMNAVIYYDDISKTAYFQFITDREYIVRFRDARSIIEYLNLVNEFGMNGISVWNIMQFNPQLWMIVNAFYDIDVIDA